MRGQASLHRLLSSKWWVREGPRSSERRNRVKRAGRRFVFRLVKIVCKFQVRWHFMKYVQLYKFVLFLFCSKKLGGRA